MRSYYFLMVFLLTSVLAKGQCPIVNFVMPDSICAGDIIPIQNNSSNAANPAYLWDFNAVDLRNSPSGKSSGNFVAQLSSGLGVDFALDNGTYYAVSINTSGILSRFDFGNSMQNTPTATTLGNLGIMASNADIRLLNDNGNWYAFTNTLSGSFYRINFGNSLSNFPTINTVNINPALFNTAYYMSVEKVKNNFVAVISNYSSGNVTVVDFGNDITNINPSAFNIPLTSPNPISAVIASDCDQIYAYIGYATASSLTQIAFGSAINNSPTLTNISLPGVSYRKIDLVEDGGGFTILAQSFSGDLMHQYNFGANLGNTTPTFKDLGSFSAMSNGAYAFSANKIGSNVFGLVTNYNSGDLTTFSFPESNSEAGTMSTDIVPGIAFNSPGYHVISLKVIDSLTGASEFYTDSIYVNLLPDPGYVFSNACEGAAVELTDTTAGSGLTSNWLFSTGASLTGKNVSYQFPGAGDYGLSLTVTSSAGCSSTLNDSILIYELPDVQFTFLNNECAEANILFTNNTTVAQGTISSYSWDFGDNNTSSSSDPIHAYAQNGTFQVRLAVLANGCADTLIQAVTIKEKPAASFVVNNTCIGEITVFQNTTTIPNNVSLTYAWDLGNATFSTNENPQINYNAVPANYQVQLIANAANGCSDTSNISVRIGNKPFPSFLISTDTACAGNPVQFTDFSIPAAGETLTGFLWDFGDGTIDSTSINPAYAYPNAGTYTVTLHITSASSCDSSMSRTVYVIASPVANFISDTVCEGLITTFNENSSTPTGTVLNQWSWNFGDQSVSTIADPQHLYANNGQYTVTLRVTNDLGCYDDYTNNIIVKDKPLANFGSLTGCSQVPVQFNDSSVSGPLINFWSWNFGNTQNSNLQNPTTIYNASAVYSVELIVGNIEGCFDTITKLKAIQKTPEFSITTGDHCTGQTASFTYTPIGTPAPNLGFLWDFGDNQFDTQPITSHLYASPGSFYSSLKVTDLNNTCSMTMGDSVYVYEKPVANFATDSVCMNGTLDFTDLSSVNNSQISGWLWNLGAYGQSTLKNPSITTNVADSFPVTLIVTTNNGCRDTAIQFAEVYENPNSSFTASHYFGAPPLPVQFTNTSDAGLYLWEFGDATPNSTQQNPLHIYSDTGTYQVILNTTSNRGCVSTYSNTITLLNPLLDLALENISFTEVNGFWEIGARIKNQSNLPITTFELSARLDEYSQIRETFSDITLQPGQSALTTFSSRFSSENNASPEYLCVTIETINDTTDNYTENNTRCIATTDKFSLIDIFPNPVASYLNGSYNLTAAGQIEMTIYNLQGQIIYSEGGIAGLKGYNNFLIPCNNLASGVYILQLSYDGQQIYEKFLKK